MQDDLKSEVREILEKKLRVGMCVNCHKVCKQGDMKQVDFGRDKYNEKLAEICKICYDGL